MNQFKKPYYEGNQFNFQEGLLVQKVLHRYRLFLIGFLLLAVGAALCWAFTKKEFKKVPARGVFVFENKTDDKYRI